MPSGALGPLPATGGLALFSDVASGDVGVEDDARAVHRVDVRPVGDRLQNIAGAQVSQIYGVSSRIPLPVMRVIYGVALRGGASLIRSRVGIGAIFVAGTVVVLAIAALVAISATGDLRSAQVAAGFSSRRGDADEPRVAKEGHGIAVVSSRRRLVRVRSALTFIVGRRSILRVGDSRSHFGRCTHDRANVGVVIGPRTTSHINGPIALNRALGDLHGSTEVSIGTPALAA